MWSGDLSSGQKNCPFGSATLKDPYEGLVTKFKFDDAPLGDENSHSEIVDSSSWGHHGFGSSIFSNSFSVMYPRQVAELEFEFSTVPFIAPCILDSAPECNETLSLLDAVLPTPNKCPGNSYFSSMSKYLETSSSAVRL